MQQSDQVSSEEDLDNKQSSSVTSESSTLLDNQG